MELATGTSVETIAREASEKASKAFLGVKEEKSLGRRESLSSRQTWAVEGEEKGQKGAVRRPEMPGCGLNPTEQPVQ